MALAHVVSSAAAQGNNVSSITTVGVNTTGADLLVVTVSRDSTATPAATPVSDSKTNTWSGSFAEQGGPTPSAFTRQHASTPVSVGAAHTFTFTLAAAGFPSIAASAFSGTAQSAVLDKTAQGTDTTTPHNSPLTATLAQADEVVVGSYSDEGLTEGIAIGAGYSAGAVADSTASLQSIGHEWKIVASTAAVQSDFTTTANENSANGVATYKASAAAGSVVSPRLSALLGVGS